MDPAALASLAGWLDRPEIRAVDPARVTALRAALDAPDPPVRAGRHGALVCYAPEPGRRRLLEFDRRGTLVAALRWEADGGLRWARCMIPDGQWVGIEPGGADHPAWGRSDRVWRVGEDPAFGPAEPLTVFQSLEYARLDVIPPLAEPRRLLPGAGTAVLNLLAGLMKDQGLARARYRGPYPTEQLFTALLECFRYDPAVDSPLERFTADGALDWLPAPYEGHHVAPGVYVQLRQEVDKVVIAGAAFYRPDWQAVLRREPRVVRPAGDRLVCSLWALGQPIEDRLVLDGAGEVLEVPAARLDARPPAPLPPVWNAALGALVARESAPALGAPIRQVLAALPLEAGPVPGDLLRFEESAVRISRRLFDTATSWIGGAPSAPERAARALGFILEVARLLGPEARLRAQMRLEALPEAAQQEALAAAEERGPEPLDESVGRLLVLVASGAAHS